MRPHLSSPAAALSALVLTLAVCVSACGGDDDPAPSASSGSTGSSGSSGTTAPSGSDPAPGPVEGTDVVPDVAANPTTDIIASSIETVMEDVTGYEIDGDAITMMVDGPKSSAGSKCVIATSVLDSFEVPEATTITFQYSDGSETC